MKSQARHDPEDRLLELAYGELPEAEARALQEHLKDCPRCTESLRQMRSVRTAMAPLAEERVPDAGLDSLLAYAKSSAQRNAQAAAPARLGWRRFVMPVAGLAAASLFGVVVLREHQELDVTQPAAEQRVDKMAAEQQPAPVQYSATEAPVAQAPAPAPVTRGVASDRRSNSAIPPRKRALPEEEAKSMERLPSFANDGALAEGRGAAREEIASAGAAPQEAEPSDMMADSSAGAPAAPPKKSEVARAQAPAAPAAAAPAAAAKASKAAPDAEGLAREAQAARAEGDRVQEAQLLRAALAAGAKDRAGLLRRLCEAELASGRTAEAREACRAALAQSPGSDDGRAAQRLLEKLDAPSAPAQ